VSAVYLLHFSRKYYGANNGHPNGVRHYIGYAADGDVERRLAEHLRGQGSPLVKAVVAAGIRVQLVLHVEGDRGLERRWKNRHGHTRGLCPLCHQARTRQYRLPFRTRGRQRAASVVPLWRAAA